MIEKTGCLVKKYLGGLGWILQFKIVSTVRADHPVRFYDPSTRATGRHQWVLAKGTVLEIHAHCLTAVRTNGGHFLFLEDGLQNFFDRSNPLSDHFKPTETQCCHTGHQGRVSNVINTGS
jgi:hypothetical protein